MQPHMHLSLGPSEPKDRALNSESIHRMDGSELVTPQRPQWFLKVKSNTACMTLPASLPHPPFLPSPNHSGIITLPRAHYTVIHLSWPLHAVPSLWSSLPYSLLLLSMQFQGLLLLETPLTPHQLNYSEGLPALPLCAGAGSAQMPELLENREGSFQRF